MHVVWLMAGLFVAAAAAQTPDVWDEQARAAVAAGRMEDAEALWTRALTANPAHFPSLFNFGFSQFGRKQYGEAVELLERAAQARPADFNTRYVLGAAYSQLTRTDRAIRAWRAALALDPRNTRLLQLLIVEYGKGRYFQEAVALSKQALALRSDESNFYFLGIKACQDAGNLETGAQWASEAVRRFPHLARANFEHAFYLQKRGDVAAAEAHLRKAMELDPAYEEPPFFLGDLLVKQGKNEEALAPLRMSIDRRNDYVPARVLLGRALMNLERWDDAIRELKQTAEMDPRHPQPHLLLSQVYFRQGREAEAREERELSLRLRRENPTVLEAVQGRPFVP